MCRNYYLVYCSTENHFDYRFIINLSASESHFLCYIIGNWICFDGGTLTGKTSNGDVDPKVCELFHLFLGSWKHLEAWKVLHWITVQQDKGVCVCSYHQRTCPCWPLAARPPRCCLWSSLCSAWPLSPQSSPWPPGWTPQCVSGPKWTCKNIHKAA